MYMHFLPVSKDEIETNMAAIFCKNNNKQMISTNQQVYIQDDFAYLFVRNFHGQN